MGLEVFMEHIERAQRLFGRYPFIVDGDFTSADNAVKIAAAEQEKTSEKMPNPAKD